MFTSHQVQGNTLFRGGLTLFLVFLCAGALWGTHPALAQSTDEPLYSDDFEAASSGWRESESEERSTYYADGEFVIDLLRGDWYTWQWAQEQSFDNALIEVDVRLINGDSGASYGLVLRGADNDNFYYVELNNQGQVRIGKQQEDSWRAIPGGAWQHSDAILVDDAVNRLTVAAKDNQLAVFVNGEHITTVTDDAFASGQVGVFAGAAAAAEPASVAFDNFAVYAVADLPPSLAGNDQVGFFAEDFSGASLDWRTGTGEYSDKAIVDGEFVFAVTQPNRSEWVTVPREKFDDFVVESDVRPLVGTADGRYGLVFRKVDNDNFYYFRINGDGEYQVRKRVDGGWQAVADMDWTASPSLNTGSEANLLRIEAIGPVFTFYANDDLLTTVEDESFALGQLGFIVQSTAASGPVTAAFDNYHAYAPGSETMREEPDATGDQALGDDANPRVNGELIFSDEFDGSAAPPTPLFGEKWMTLDREAGEARLATTASGSVLPALYLTSVPADFLAEVDFRFGEDRGGAFGLVFRSDDPQGGLDFYYAIDVRPQRNEARFQVWQDDEWVVQEEYAVPEGLLDAEGTNQLRIEAVGDDIRGYVNGLLLINVQDDRLPDEGYFGPYIVGGADISPGTEEVVYLDNLYVYEPESQTSDATWSADTTSELAKLVEAAPVGGVVALDATTYTLNGTLVISKPLTLVGAGMDQTVVVGSDGDRMIYLLGPARFGIEGITFRYAGDEVANVAVVSDGALTISDARFTGGVWSSDLGFGGTGLLLWGTTTGRVTESVFENNGLHGVELKDEANLELEDNRFERNGENGVAFFDASRGSVRHNISSNNGLHGISADNDAEVALEENICSENAEIGIRISGQALGTLRANEATGNGLHGITVIDTAAPIVTANILKNNVESGLVYFGNAAGAARDNQCSENGLHGIGVEDQARPTLERNICTDNGEDGFVYFGEAGGIARDNICSQNGLHGIGVSDSASPLLEGNECIGNTEIGIRISGTSTSIVRRNTTNGNLLHGIQVRENAEPVLEENSANGNAEGGIVFVGESAGLARNNTCDDNTWGLYVEETADPILLDNSCTGNSDSDVEDLRQSTSADEVTAAAVATPEAIPTKPTAAVILEPTKEPAIDDSGLYLEDDFSDPAAGWALSESEVGRVWVEGEELQILNYTDSTLEKDTSAGLTVGDVILEADSRLLDGSEDNWHDFLCRYVDLDNYYVAGYSADGYVGATVKVNGDIVQRVGPEPSDAIRQGQDVTNHVKLACIGDTIQFWVNDVQVIDMAEGSLEEGDIGMAVSANGGDFSHGAIDNVIVYAPTGEEREQADTVEEIYALVTADALNVRAGPGASYDRLGSLAQGDFVLVTGRNANCSWLRVEIAEGVGWASSSYLNIADACSSLPEVTVESAPISVATQAPAVATVAPVVGKPGVLTSFEPFGTWRRGDEAWGTFTQSAEQSRSGSYSGKFDYDFPANVPEDRNYVVFMQTIPIGGEPQELTAQVYGDGSGSFLNTWVKDASGQLWQFSFGQIDHTGWKTMTRAARPKPGLARATGRWQCNRTRLSLELLCVDSGLSGE